MTRLWKCKKLEETSINNFKKIPESLLLDNPMISLWNFEFEFLNLSIYITFCFALSFFFFCIFFSFFSIETEKLSATSRGANRTFSGQGSSLGIRTLRWIFHRQHEGNKPRWKIFWAFTSQILLKQHFKWEI